jgi:hypothetical protein
VWRMTSFDNGAVSRPEVPTQPVIAVTEDSIPAARLLAHDMEALVWDDDADGVLPPPD